MLILWQSSLGTKAEIIEAENIEQNGYKKYGDGMLIQWGYSTYAGNTINMYFPTSFYYANYSIVTCATGGAATVDALSLIIVREYLSYCVVRGIASSHNTHSNPFYWIAIGRWK